jgi:hypothetical protein
MISILTLLGVAVLVNCHSQVVVHQSSRFGELGVLTACFVELSDDGANDLMVNVQDLQIMDVP